MPPRTVVCHCDPDWPAYSVCRRCELAQLHRVLLRRGVVADNPIVAAAYDALAEAYLDECDADDRAYDAAQAHELEQSA